MGSTRRCLVAVGVGSLRIGMGDTLYASANVASCVQKMAAASERAVPLLTRTFNLDRPRDVTIAVQGVCGLETASYLRLMEGGTEINRFTLRNNNFSYPFGELPQGNYRLEVVSVRVPGYSDIDDFYIQQISLNTATP